MVHHLVFYLVPAQLPLPLLPLSGFCTLSGSSSLVYSCGGALLLGWRCLDTPLGFSTLCQRSSPFCCLPLAGAATFLAPVAGLLLRWCLVVGLEVSLLHHLVFYHVPCSSSGACSFPSFPSCRFPWEFSGHQVSVLLLPWCRRLGISTSLLFLCFFCSDWLAGVSWVLHPVSGCSSWCGVCSLVDCVVTLLAFPYLGWVSFWTVVSPVSVGCEGGLDCPSWFVHIFMSLFVLHRLWGWGGLVTGL